ncbi:hypothetical protein FF098_014670 [Parvularcula flava]|uniref:Lipoprotein n=1 Tax=Aquisalinus luteolus TaxID=1566827 RepID=A0A8J3A9Y3_9PROT|nr:hypothetical protein [Aquisalinus luteolus]NHK29161.1 hypothetical protein [Aquisalinus luteolus]GGI00119.1 hypothetical protein GCM10011355_27660 [Aquisalinus luteolus]
MKKTLLIAVAIAVTVSACATKRYPIATELSTTEVQLMDCKDLSIEMARIDAMEVQIAETAETDWRSVAGFLGDYGIGNAMAKSEATKALAERRASVRGAQVQKNCQIY